MAIGIILGIIIAGLIIGAFVYMFKHVEEAGYTNNDQERMKERKKVVIALIVIISLCLSFIIVPFSFHTVQTGEVAVVKHFGKAKEIKEAGLHYDFWITNKYVTYDTKVRGIYIEDAAYSSDAQQMDLKISFQYQIMSDKVMDITKSYGSLKLLDARIQAIVQENTKAVLSKYKAMDIIANRTTLSPEVEKMVSDSLGGQYFVNVVNLALTNIDFSDAFETAVEEKMIAEQKQLKATYDAEAKIVSAEATAKANELLERSLTDKILQEMYINKWDGKLPQVVSDGNAMFQIPNIQ